MRTSTSFKDVADLGRVVGFDLAFRQLDCGPPSIPATLLLGEHVTLASMSFKRAYHQLGSTPEGMTTIGMPTRGLRNWYGSDFAASSILPFRVACGIDGVSEPGFQAMTLSVSDDFMRLVSESCQIPVADILTSPSPDSVIANSRPTQFLRAVASSLFKDRAARLNLEVEQELVVALLNASLSETAILDKSKPAQRSRAIAKALAYINEHSSEAIWVRDVCSNTGVALRTLNRAFHERFGIGPKAYLVRQRLSNVHAELSRVPADTPVADVANHWGFWHMGQFAKDYRAAFGELPSATVKRSQTSVRRGHLASSHGNPSGRPTGRTVTAK